LNDELIVAGGHYYNDQFVRLLKFSMLNAPSQFSKERGSANSQKYKRKITEWATGSRLLSDGSRLTFSYTIL